MKIMMFHPDNLEQRELSEDNARKAEDQGWVRVSNVPLVQMFHPGINRAVNVPEGDQKTWENKGYYAEPTVLYHPTEGDKLFPAAEAKKLLAGKTGWFDSPAKFPKSA